MLTAVKKEIVENHLKTLKQAGIIPGIVSISSVALDELLVKSKEEEKILLRISEDAFELSL